MDNVQAVMLNQMSPSSRMLKKSASSVLASFPGAVKRETRVSSAKLRPCLGQGASWGEESVLADSGREGEIPAGVGQVRSLAFLSILRECSPVVPHKRTIEALLCRNGFSAAC